ASALGSLPRRDPGKAVRTYHEGPDRTLRIGSFYFAENRNFLLCSDSGLLRLSRQSEKFRFEQSRKFLLTAVRLKDGTNRDEPRGTRQAGLVETSPRRKHDAARGGAEDGSERPLGAHVAEGDEETGRRGSGTCIARPGVEPQDRGQGASPGHGASEATRVARLRTHFCQPTVG